eukprot:Hpha_TRINITY_DN27244_c0_g1::TRINITY_DN27244_c0_g1_i1::g.140744::m.140744
MRPPESDEDMWGYVVKAPTPEGAGQGEVLVDFSESGGPADAVYTPVQYLAPRPVSDTTFVYHCAAAPDGPIGRWQVEQDGERACDFLSVRQSFDERDGKYKLILREARAGARRAGVVMSARYLSETRKLQPPQGALWAAATDDGGVHWLHLDGERLVSDFVAFSRDEAQMIERVVGMLVPFEVGDRVAPIKSLVCLELGCAGRYEAEFEGKWVPVVLTTRLPDGSYEATTPRNASGTAPPMAFVATLPRIRRSQGAPCFDSLSLQIGYCPSEPPSADTEFSGSIAFSPDGKEFKQVHTCVLESRQPGRRTTLWDRTLQRVPCKSSGVTYIRVKFSQPRMIGKKKKIDIVLKATLQQHGTVLALEVVKVSEGNERNLILSLTNSKPVRVEGGEDWRLDEGEEAAVALVGSMGDVIVRNSCGAESRTMPPSHFVLLRPATDPGTRSSGHPAVTEGILPDGRCHAVVVTEQGRALTAAELAAADAVKFTPAEVHPQSPRKNPGERVWVTAWRDAEQTLTVRWASGHTATVAAKDLSRALPCSDPAEPYRSGGGRKGSRFCHAHRCLNVYCSGERQHWWGMMLCKRCVCAVEGCTAQRSGGQCCRDHGCISAGCTLQRAAPELLFCADHEAMRSRGVTGGRYTHRDDKYAVAPVRGVRGLANLYREGDLDNVCYMNSVLQCLSHSPGLSFILRASIEEKRLVRQPAWTGSILQAVSLTLRRLWEIGGDGEPQRIRGEYFAEVLRAE